MSNAKTLKALLGSCIRRVFLWCVCGEWVACVRGHARMHACCMPRRPRSADLLGLERDTTTLRARQKWLSVFDILGDYEFGMPTVRLS